MTTTEPADQPPAGSVPLSDLYFELRVNYATRRIAVCGGVDAACAPNVATAVARLQRAAAGDITVELDQVTFIDMSGLGVLVGARTTQLDRGDRLIITGAGPQVRRLFDLGAPSGLLNPNGAPAAG